MKYKSNGVYLPNILTVIFVVAKILGYIKWSWWLVFMPTIIPAAIVVLVMVIVIALDVIYGD